MEFLSDIVYVHHAQCPRCGKRVKTTSTIKDVELYECDKCGTIFRNHFVVYAVEEEDIEYMDVLGNN